MKEHQIVVWELTRECDLNCYGCPSPPVKRANELTTFEAYHTIDQIAAVSPRESS